MALVLNKREARVVVCRANPANVHAPIEHVFEGGLNEIDDAELELFQANAACAAMFRAGVLRVQKHDQVETRSSDKVLEEIASVESSRTLRHMLDTHGYRDEWRAAIIERHSALNPSEESAVPKESDWNHV